MVARWQHPNKRDPLSLPVELRRAPIPRAVLAWVERSAGAPVAGVRRLPGASSTAVHQLRLGTGLTVVLRSYVWPGFLADEPDAPQREVDAIGWAGRAGLPAPNLIAVDVTGETAGVPLILMERLAGRAQARPPVERFAELAVQIHAVSAGEFGHDWFPWCRATSTRAPEGAAIPGIWERAHELWRETPPLHRLTFIHRDFHPGNVLWRRRMVTGVVDWANACQGPPGMDVATGRWLLEDWADQAEADRFVDTYEKLSGSIQHPYWDLAALLQDDWDLGKPSEYVRKTEEQLARVLARCG